MIDLFADILGRSVVVSETEASQLSEELSAAISGHISKSRDRDTATIAHHVKHGAICEIGIAKLLGERNTQKWDMKNRSSFSYDVVDRVHNMRHEVKHQTGDFWSFRPEAIKTLLNNIAASGLDTIITAEYHNHVDGYIVKPKLIIEPKTFRKYLCRSHYSPGQFYYDHKLAAFDKQCIIITSWD